MVHKDFASKSWKKAQLIAKNCQTQHGFDPHAEAFFQMGDTRSERGDTATFLVQKAAQVFQ